MASSEVVKLVLRLPKGLHKRLTLEAKQNGLSLNTHIIRQLEGAPASLKAIIESTAKATVEASVGPSGNFLFPVLPGRGGKSS